MQNVYEDSRYLKQFYTPTAQCSCQPSSKKTSFFPVKGVYYRESQLVTQKTVKCPTPKGTSKTHPRLMGHHRKCGRKIVSSMDLWSAEKNCLLGMTGAGHPRTLNNYGCMHKTYRRLNQPIFQNVGDCVIRFHPEIPQVGNFCKGRDSQFSSGTRHYMCCPCSSGQSHLHTDNICWTQKVTLCVWCV